MRAQSERIVEIAMPSIVNVTERDWGLLGSSAFSRRYFLRLEMVPHNATTKEAAKPTALGQLIAQKGVAI